jgi:two-component system OmpR family response regulator
MLPKKDGLTIIREIRNSGSSLPIIVLSARGSVDARIQGLEAGADDYIPKPFSIAELLARVQTVMRRISQIENSTVLKVEDLEMDLVSHRVTRNGRKIELQPLEYQLLEYLMRNKGRVVTKNTILERVWDYDFDPHTNVVEARVYKLREKIEREGEKRLITTIRGFGYVLGA